MHRMGEALSSSTEKSQEGEASVDHLDLGSRTLLPSENIAQREILKNCRKSLNVEGGSSSRLQQPGYSELTDVQTVL